MNNADDLTTFCVDDIHFETRHTRKFSRRKPYVPRDPTRLTALIPGVIREVHVRPGQRVNRGDSLVVLEAMKMQNDLKASASATVSAVHVEAGQRVAKGQLIVEFAGIEE